MKTKLFLTIAIAIQSVYGLAQNINVYVGSYSKCDTCFSFSAFSSGVPPTTTYQWTFTGSNPKTDSGQTVTYCSQYAITNSDTLFLTMSYIDSVMGAQTIYYNNLLTALLPGLGVNLTLQNVCVVTVDTSINKNIVIWEQTTDTSIASYNLYKESSTSGVYNLLANIPRNAYSTYTDTSSQPGVKSARYYLTTNDSCTNSSSESPAGPSHKTMHLTVSSGISPTWNLVWENYDGLTSLQYRIWRNSVSTGWQVIDSVSGSSTTYSDLNPPAGLLSYLIEMISPTVCNPSFKSSQLNAVAGSSLSNRAYNSVTGINEIADLSNVISVGPNPFNHFTKIDLHRVSKQNLKVVLRTTTGLAVMQYDDVKTDELIIEKNNLSQGIYFLEVTGNSFNARKKLVVD